jgi:SWI/SNF-related matrix-associated actin-dependent regulator of chromatin subfamily A member 5
MSSEELEDAKPAAIDNDSDIEITGMDLDDDEEAEPEPDDDMPMDESERPDEPEVDNDVAELASIEAREMEEARKERMELVAAETAPEKMTAVTPQERLEYLMAQSEVFAHFLAGSVAAGKKHGQGSRGKKGRMTEAEEDAQLLKVAQSKRRVIRLDKQPSNLAAHCKMHPYQLEGLNWLIKLHDHGINGILAGESFMCKCSYIILCERKTLTLCCRTSAFYIQTKWYVRMRSFLVMISDMHNRNSLHSICFAVQGLGKTLQTISLLAYLRESRGVRGPHLVVAPKSVVSNWLRELKMWCPSIKAIKMGGTKAERQNFMAEEFPVDPNTGRHKWDVLVTSYEGILKMKGIFGKINWRYLIIDEGM